MTTLTTIQHRRHEGRDSQCRHVVSPRLVVNFRQENELDCLQIIMKWKLGTFQPQGFKKEQEEAREEGESMQDDGD